MRVFLTGGTGLVGSHVAERLVARGHTLRALVREGSDATHLAALGEIVRGDMTSSVAQLTDAMRGCDALVHSAALVGARTTREHYLDMNVEGTRAVLTAAGGAGATRVVHVSSVAVYGTIDGNVTEDRWQELPIHARAFYAWSKRASEIEAWQHHESGRLRVTTVRPALIYGERDRHVSKRLDRLLRLPLLPLPDGGRHVPPLVYAGNVARAIVSALETPASEGRAYNVAQDHRAALRDFVRTWCEARGRRAPMMPNLPGSAIVATARGIDYLSGRVPGIDLPGLRRPARLMGADNPYDSGRARRELDWDDVVPVTEAIQRTVAWLRASDAIRTSER